MVGKYHCVFLSAMAINDVDCIGNFLFGQQLVYNAHVDPVRLRNELHDLYAPGRSLHPDDFVIAIYIHGLKTNLHFRVERHRTAI